MRQNIRIIVLFKPLTKIRLFCALHIQVGNFLSNLIVKSKKNSIIKVEFLFKIEYAPNRVKEKANFVAIKFCIGNMEVNMPS